MGDPISGREFFAVTTYLADKELSIRVIRWLLKTLCLWPHSSNASIVDRVVSEFHIFTSYCFIFITMVPCGLAIFIDGRENMEMMMLHIGPFVYYIMSCVKYLFLLLHVDDIRICVEYIEMDWRIVKGNEDRKVMLRNANIGRLIASLIAACMHSVVQCYNISRCFNNYIVNVGNSSVLIRELPFPFYNEILDTRFSPTYEVMVVVQCISTFFICAITIALCSLIAVFVMHACGQLKILTMRLDNIVDDDADVGMMQRNLGFIVEHHLRVIDFISHVEETIYLTCLVELIGCSFSLCLLGYCCMMAWNNDKKQNIPTYCGISVSFILNIFVLCYIGETLSEQYRQVGTSAYMTEWYRLPRKIALGLLLINLRSNSYNISLTAGKMTELSLSTFGNVLKASLTYLNMLRAITS